MTGATVIDLPGHGCSGGRPGRSRRSAVAGGGAARAAWLGWSMGGAGGAAYALDARRGPVAAHRLERLFAAPGLAVR